MKKLLSFVLALAVALPLMGNFFLSAYAYTDENDDEFLIEEPCDDYDTDDVYNIWDIPEPLLAEEITNGEVMLTWKKYLKANEYRVYVYNSKSGKYKLYKTIGRDSYEFARYYTYVEGLESEKTYKFMLRVYDATGEKIAQEKTSLTTSPAAPMLTVSHMSSKILVKWVARQKNASGYELYTRTANGENDFLPTDKYYAAPLPKIKEDGFKLAKSSRKKASAAVSYKTGKTYEVLVRTYAVVDGEKKYSAFSTVYNSDNIDSYLNAVKLDPKKVCGGNELELVRKYVDPILAKGENNYETMLDIFEMVYSHGEYQNDITKIDGNRPVWQIMEKQEGQCASWAYCLDAMLEYAGFDVKVVRGLRSSGQQHFWNMIKINGKWYNLDAHLGTFLSPYNGKEYREYVVQEKY